MRVVEVPDPYESGAMPDAPLPQMPPRTDEAIGEETTAGGGGRFLLDWDRMLGDPLGWRSALTDRGVALHASLAIDWVKVLRGGANTEGDSWLHVFNANITVDTERLLDFKGGTFFANFQNQHGDAPSLDVGDWQGTNSNEAEGLTKLSEIYYQQILLDEKVQLKLGKLDAANDFNYTDNGLEFLHNGMAWSVTNFAQPTVDTNAFGGNVFVYPCDRFYAGLGVYDGASQEGKLTGKLGPKTLFDEPSDLYFAGEAGLLWEELLGRAMPGRLSVGAWGHTGTFDRFDGGTDSGTSGFYVTFDLILWSENIGDYERGEVAGQGTEDQPAGTEEDDDQGVGVFAIYGWAEPDVSVVEHHVAFGGAWKGPIPTRDDDTTGIGASLAIFSDEDGAGVDDEFELAIEAFYKVQITPWFSLKPDLQYVINPGGLASQRNAVVATVRAEIAF